jgi:acetyltransferase
VLAKVAALRRSTGVVFVSVSMGPLSYGPDAQLFTKRWKLAFLQGHRAATGAIAALVDLQEARARATTHRPPHPNRTRAMRLLRNHTGPLDEVRAGRVLELYGVRRPPEAVSGTPEAAARAAMDLGFPVAVKALAPELPHKAKLGGVRLGLGSPAEVEDAAAAVLRAARTAGASAPKVLVQRMVQGHEVLVGAVVDERFGACVTMRPGGGRAEAGEATFVVAPMTRRQALAFVRSQAVRCGLDPRRHDLHAAARAVEAVARAAHDLRGRLTSLEANPLLVGTTGAVAVDALAETGPIG